MSADIKKSYFKITLRSETGRSRQLLKLLIEKGRLKWVELH